MTTWLCLVRSKSWDIIRKNQVYGLPFSKKNELEKIKIGDLLAIYIIHPLRKIIGVCKVVSQPYVGYEDIWGKNSHSNVKYPYRIKVEPIDGLVVSKKDSIPLHIVFGYVNSKKGYIIEPYLRNIFFLKMTDKQSKTLLSKLSKLHGGENN